MFNECKKIYALIIALLFVLIYSNVSYSQDMDEESTRPLQFSIYGTLGGYGLLYSLGGELLFNRNIGFNIGYSSWDITAEEAGGTTEGKAEFQFIPIHGAYYIGGNHRLYLEAGTTYVKITIDNFSDDAYIFEDGTESAFFLTGGIGYNYCPIDGHFYFKIGALFYVIESKVLPWGGMSLGVTF